MIDVNRRYYTVLELAEIIPLGKNSLYRLVNQEDFPKITFGKKIMIPVDELEKYLNSKLNKKIDL